MVAARYINGNVGEWRVRKALRRCGVGDAQVEEQFQVGPFRLDFAFPLYRVGIEADGWVHTTQKIRQSDRRRDAKLASWGWHIYRIDIDDEDAVGPSVARIVAVIERETMSRRPVR